MLPRIIASPCFVLPCLWVAALAVFALPMPTGGKDAAVVFGPQPPMIVDLHIIIAKMNTIDEHSMIGIGNTVLHANLSNLLDRTPNTILTPRRLDIPLKILKEDYDTVLIGEARFKDEKDFQEAIEEMLKVKLPPIRYKGTCRDYIWKVLQELKRYREIYNERYEQVFKDQYAKLSHVTDQLFPAEKYNRKFQDQ
ncbi:hypothetical protein EV359DRAFT_68290 [Lentinula novae-zelandiae]|nr:hypothetical protein EV359DRAFT_68290 [Lentinula novae-zelandiae]